MAQPSSIYCSRRRGLKPTFHAIVVRMTHRERLLSPFRGTKPDRPAWLADLSYWYSAAESAGTLEERYRTRDGYKRLHEDLGVCYYYDYSSHLFTTRHDGVDFATVEKGAERLRTWRSARGTLAEHWTYLPQAMCWAHDRYAVSNPEELRLLLDISARTSYVSDTADFSLLLDWVGDAGLPLAPAPRSPLPALLADWCGVENTIFLLMDHPEIASEIMSCIDRANDAAFDALVSGPCELIHFCDNLDSSASTPFFDRWMKDYYEKRLRQIHSAGKYAVVHLDGRVRGLLPKLSSCGFDGIESITPAPVGDITIEELRATMASSRTIMWGGIPGAMFSTPWTAGDIRGQAERLLDALEEGGRLVVGSADQIPPNGSLGYCRVIADTIDSWARHRSPVPR